MNLIKKFPARTGLALLLAFIIISVILLIQYAAGERERDLATWQSRLGMLADMRRVALENELQSRRDQLRELAENPSLQLYLLQYNQATDKDDEILRAQFSHVRNLLGAVSERFGFAKQLTAVNLDTTNEYGLAVFDQQGHLLASSAGFGSEVAAHDLLLKQALQDAKPALIDLYTTTTGKPAYGFVMPVFHIQRSQFSQPVGAVLVLFDPSQHLFRQLENTHLDTQSDETLLLRKQQNSLMFISPLQKDFALFHQIPSENSYLAETLAWQQPASFISGLDYRGTKVLATGRAIKDTPWFLLQKIDAKEALAESDRHQRFLFSSFLLLILLLAASFVAIWRHSTSVRLQQLTASLEAQTALLNAVSDNIHELIFLLDANQHLLFANQSLAQRLDISPRDAAGKNLASLLGPDVANSLNKIINATDNSSDIITLQIGDTHNSYHVARSVLQQGDYRHATLLVLHDITALKSAQEKRDRLAQGIIATLVKAVDLHDPYCVDHSARTREVALCIAEELGLDKPRREALEMASLLANIGKLFLPREILTKMEPLTENENELLKKHIDYAVDILQQLHFEGPVVDIIAQKNEYLDGSGYPRGLKGDSILTESRILAVANAFVAMASARAYREGRPIQDVLDILLQQADQRYDRHVVAALFHIAENKADWRRWQISAR